MDVDGLGGRVIGCVQAAVDGSEHLQHSFSQAWLEHHTATPYTHILTAWIQVGDTHRDWMGVKTQAHAQVKIINNDKG